MKRRDSGGCAPVNGMAGAGHGNFMRTTEELHHAREILERALAKAVAANASESEMLQMAGPVGVINWVLGLPTGDSLQKMIESVDAWDREQARRR